MGEREWVRGRENDKVRLGRVVDPTDEQKETAAGGVKDASQQEDGWSDGDEGSGSGELGDMGRGEAARWEDE